MARGKNAKSDFPLFANKTKKGSAKRAWNSGKAMGQKRAFTPQELAEIASQLQRIRDDPLSIRNLAILRTGVDTMLRASDLLALTVGDVYRGGVIVSDFDVRQKKTQASLNCDLLEEARAALAEWIRVGWDFEPDPADRLFPITRRAYGNIVKAWATMIRLDPTRYGTHSIRRSKAREVYRRTKNLEVVRQLLGQKSLGATSAYLGIDREDARAISKEVRI